MYWDTEDKIKGSIQEGVEEKHSLRDHSLVKTSKYNLARKELRRTK